jgi:hypothetical protein
MTVKELIEELSKYSPDLELNFSCGIESGRSYDVCNDGDIDIEMEDLSKDEILEKFLKEADITEDDLEDDEDLEAESEDYIRDYKQKLNINISGDCTDYD